MSLKALSARKDRRYPLRYICNNILRYLHKYEGYSWNDIYSELRRRWSYNVDFDGYIHYTVEQNVTMKNNIPYDNKGYPIYGFYVYEDILYYRARPKYKHKPTKYGIGDDIRYLRIDGVWFRLFLEPKDYRGCLLTPIGMSYIFNTHQVVKRESLSKRDINKLNLNDYNNDPYCNLTLYKNGYYIGGRLHKDQFRW